MTISALAVACFDKGSCAISCDDSSRPSFFCCVLETTKFYQARSGQHAADRKHFRASGFSSGLQIAASKSDTCSRTAFRHRSARIARKQIEQSCSRDNVRLTPVTGAGRRYLYSKLIKLVGPFKLLSVSECMAGALPLSQDFFRSSVLLAPLPNFSRTCRLVGLCTRVPSKVQAAMQEMGLSKLQLPDVLPSDLWIRIFSFLAFSYKCVAVWHELLCC